MDGETSFEMAPSQLQQAASICGKRLICVGIILTDSTRVSTLHYVQPGMNTSKFFALSNTKEEIYVLVAVQLKCALV